MSEAEDLSGFLDRIGASSAPHSGRTYGQHCIGIYNLLLSLGFDRHVCRAGFFHSIYGTERFQDFVFSVSSREKIQALIGHRAEHIAFANCSIPRSDLDRAVFSDWDCYDFDFSGKWGRVSLNLLDFTDLMAVHLGDWIEQVPHLKNEWPYRFQTYARIASRLGGLIQSHFNLLFDPDRKRNANA